jgi:3-methyl-2-oxobutanoate hydroxymethyltransferase
MFDGFTPKHSRRYAEAGKIITDALASYARDVREGTFPADENCF